jgi:hypothetical protein
MGSGRQDGQGDAKAVHRLGHSGVPDEGQRNLVCLYRLERLAKNA